MKFARYEAMSQEQRKELREESWQNGAHLE